MYIYLFVCARLLCEILYTTVKFENKSTTQQKSLSLKQMLGDVLSEVIFDIKHIRENGYMHSLLVE